MKKLLTLLGIVGVVTTTSTTVIACSTKVPEIQAVKEINEISGDLEKILQRRVKAQWTEKELQAEIDLEYSNQGITVEKSKQTTRTFELQKNSWIFIGNATRTNQHHYHGRVKLEHRWNKDTSTDIWEIKDVLTNLVYEKKNGTDVLKDYEYKAWTKEALDEAVHDLGGEYAGITVSITKEDDFKWRYTFTGDGDISQEHQYSNHVDVKHILGSETKYIDPTNNEEKQSTNGKIPEGVTEVTQIGWDGNRQVHKMPVTIEKVPNEQDSIHPYIISLSSMFFFRGNSAKVKFNQDLSNWNTSKIIDMSFMFEDVTTFEGKGLKSWDVSKVENMKYMFSGSPRFNQNLSEWKTTSLKNMQYMFHNATAFQGNGLESWDVSKVTNMYGTFRKAKAFNGNITNWDTSKVTDMGSMFYEAILFDKDIKTGDVKWNTSKVTDMGSMFYGAEKFNGDITNWDTSKVTDMGSMFEKAKAFNHDLSKWVVGLVTDFNRFALRANPEWKDNKKPTFNKN
ncbi:BspA family leucine-rich repeat surface protein [Williamsoniiplasma lucivorax]|uniref:Lipoprotein n=1 Tax=Williamsoniiplasma lucivorax TaxID=209274 RepID=A0A2S5RG17_9MOLU|nr:BspA family leucine-rich repeat surface protein [Williamsoniiplasma lucivorax]PPE06162.1 hypothetical protein ELUCI_v1c04530 [Williamsoniiplasma lucivorax]